MNESVNTSFVQEPWHEPRREAPEPIAIVGMGCRWPGGISTPSQLWDLLVNKRSGFRDFDDDKIHLDGFYHPNSQRPGSMPTRGAYLLQEDPKLFDHAFFGMTPTETMTLDPSQRKILEVVYEAFENAGEPWEKFAGSKTGVFIGNFNYDHLMMQSRDTDHPPQYSSTGGSISILSNRINYLLDLRGPSMTVDTACSSSIYALHLAVNAIRNGDCDSAIVGGSNLILGPDTQLLLSKLGALSATSTCHTFDRDADGYARGEGFAAFYLKKVSDAVEGHYPIRAVVRGTAVNSNGRTAGITHPSASGQKGVILQAYENACLSTKYTGFFETHGTGTPVGDPTEVSAIGRVFSENREGSPLLIGSIKTNLGHTEAASGMAGIMKAILALEAGLIPPSIGISNFNPRIDFEAAGVHVPTEVTPWPPDKLRRASINSFGYGGANAHVIIDHISTLFTNAEGIGRNLLAVRALSNPSATSLRKDSAVSPTQLTRYSGFSSVLDPDPVLHPPCLVGKVGSSTRRRVILPFSAHDAQSLKKSTLAVADCINDLCLADVAYTLSARRSKFVHRTYCVVESRCPDKALNMEMPILPRHPKAHTPSIGFIFTGQGAQWEGMGNHLFEYEVFSNSIAYMDMILSKLSFRPSWTLRDILCGSTTLSVNEPQISQTVCTALQVGLVDLLRSWNVEAKASIGHSSGEIAAAYASGYLTAAEAIIIAYCRGQAVAKNTRNGRMIAVGLGVDQVEPFLAGFETKVKIAAINSSQMVTLSGDEAEINALLSTFQAHGTFCRALPTGGNAYHSHHMVALGQKYELLLTQALDELNKQNIHDTTQRLPQCGWISSAMPHKKMRRAALGPLYWRQNLELPVRFSEAARRLLTSNKTSIDVLVEIGPHAAMKSSVKQIWSAIEGNEPNSFFYFSALSRRENGQRTLLALCGNLFGLNASVNLAAVNAVDYYENGALQYAHGSVCVDLPKYTYNYGPVLYHENRFNKEYRLRRHLHHDILGSRQPGGSKSFPSWRNVLRPKDVPWLNDHRLLPQTVFPASGYVCMAVEAASQLFAECSPGRMPSGFTLRNVSIKTAMQITEDDSGLEVILNMEPYKSSASKSSSTWYRFSVSSVGPEDIWTEHCSGIIVPRLEQKGPRHHLHAAIDPRVIDSSKWYGKFTDIGLGYGQTFQALSNLTADPGKNIATADISLRTTVGLFTGPESRYLIHPASLDTCHQLALVACHGGQTERVRNAFVPVFIEEMSLWGAEDSEGDIGLGVAHGELRGLRGAYAQIQLQSQKGAPLVDIRNLRCITYSGGETKLTTTKPSRQPYMRLSWKPDINTLTNDRARAMFPATVPFDTAKALMDSMDRLAMFMIAEIAEQHAWLLSHDQLPAYLRKFLIWVRYCARPDYPFAEEALSASSPTRLRVIETIAEQMSNSVEVRITKRIFDHLHEILLEEKSGLGLALQDGLLNELYVSGMGIAAAYPQLEHTIDLLAHSNPHMKILEIGAGTGGASRIVLKALGAATQHPRYSDYVFTDISSAFFAKAEVEFADYDNIVFSVLDVEQNAHEQGFEAVFDLVIASESLHTTGDIGKALQNVRSLLKPGGKLVLVESTRTMIGHGLILGTFPDYWVGTEEHRVDSPFMDVEGWHSALQSSGFSGVDIALDDYPQPLTIASTLVSTAVHNEPLQLATVAVTTKHRQRTYVVYEKSAGRLVENIVTELGDFGLEACALPLEETSSVPGGSRVILTAGLEGITGVNLTDTQFVSIKTLVRNANSMVWLTAGGMTNGYNPQAAIMAGLLRVIAAENPSGKYVNIDLECDYNQDDADIARQVVEQEIRLQETLSGMVREQEYAMINGCLHISRFTPDEDLNEHFQQVCDSSTATDSLPIGDQDPVGIDFEQHGILSSLYFKSDEDFYEPLREDYLEVKTAAIGLNWKDLAVSAGRFDLDNFNSECAGVVSKVGSAVQGFQPGDRIYGLASGKFGNYMRMPAIFAQKMALQDTFKDVATVPMVFSTAVYAFTHLARLSKDEKVLIQSATGGLGLAAIQIAQYIGAEIFASVGTEEKRAYLRDMFNIPDDHLFSSREVPDLECILEITGGDGFDVILSTTSGEVMDETWRCIAPAGRFIDVGRVDVQNHGSLPMEIFKRNATFSSFDFGRLILQKPALCGRIMSEIGDMIREGAISPISATTAFDISQLEQALLFFSKGTHLGKVVVTYEDPQSMIKMMPPVPHASFDANGTYVLAGGLGGLGRSILAWMVQRGARHFVMLSRSGTTTNPETSAFLKDIRNQGVEVKVIACNVAVKDQVTAAFRYLPLDGPVRGLIHAAMSLEDRLFDKLTFDEWNRGLSAKVQGTMNLHEATVDLPLDFFIMTSSLSTHVAQPTQGAYCAANNFQDHFARYRRKMGLPATAIAFGLIAEVGELGQRAVTKNSMSRNDLYGTGEYEFLQLLESAFLSLPTNENEKATDWRRFDPLSEANIITCLEPAKLLEKQRENREGNPNSITIPRWHSDARFSHILRSMENLSASSSDHQSTPTLKPSTSQTAEVDALIIANETSKAKDLVTDAIVNRIADMLFISASSIEAGKGVAAYGVDSLIAAELRNWFVSAFDCGISFLKLLDEKTRICDLAGIVVEERREKVGVEGS